MRLSVIVSVSWPTVATPPSPACWVRCSVAIASPRWGVVSLFPARHPHFVSCEPTARHFWEASRKLATGETAGSERKRGALALFAGLQDRYDLLSAAAQLRAGSTLAPGDGGRGGRRARRSACSTWPRAPAWSPAELVRRYGCSVVGLDQSAEMLAGARRRLDAEPALAQRVELVRGEAERLAFADAEFDHLTFTYLLRYVDDPGATLAELARVVKPGGRIASLEFGLPEPPLLAAALVALHADRPAGPGPPVRPRLVRGGPLPGAEHRGAVRAVAAGSPAASSGRAPGSRRCASGA